MQVRALFFAGIREAAGVREAQIGVGEGASVADVAAEVSRRWPRVAPRLARAAVAVNLEYVDPAYRVAEGDEVAFVPPVSGGAG